MSSTKPCSGIEHCILISKEFASSVETSCKEAIVKNDALHASILHCALRKKEEGVKKPAAAKKKIGANAISLDHTNTNPFFIFVVGRNVEEIIELISNHATEQKKNNAEAPPKKPFFYYYAASIISSVNEEGQQQQKQAIVSADNMSKLSELFPSKEQLLASPSSDEASNNKTLLLSGPFKNRIAKRKSLKANSNVTVNNNQDDDLILQALLQQQQQSVSNNNNNNNNNDQPNISDFFWSSSSLEESVVVTADETWTACLDAAHLSTIVGFWYGSHAGNAEYICSQLHHMFISNERVDLADAYSSPHPAVRDFLEQNNSSSNFQSQIVLLDTLNSFVKKEMLSPIIVTRYTCVHVFVCSTHGDGDFPDNASRTKRYIIKIQTEVGTKVHAALDLIPKSFFFTVLALGDTNYSKFAEAGQLLNRKFKESGATCFKAIECPDDGLGLELVVDPYLKEVWAPFEKQLNSCLLEMSQFADEISSCRRERISHNTDDINNSKSPIVAAESSSSSSPSSLANGQQTAKSSEQQQHDNKSSASPSCFENRDGKFYEVSTVILFAPSALMHAGALQSVLVNAGLHGANSLPILLPLRAFAPLISGSDENDGEDASNNNSPVAVAPDPNALLFSQQSQRLPCAKNLFVIASSDATWWDSEENNAQSLNDETNQNANSNNNNQKSKSKKSYNNSNNSELIRLSSRVKTFAYFDIEESLCKQQQAFQESAARAFCLPQNADFLSAFSSAIVVQGGTDANNNNNNAADLRCAFTSWLRALARWLIPRTLQDSPGFVSALTSTSNNSNINNSNKDKKYLEEKSSGKDASATSTIVSRISDAVNSIVDGVIHGHHERGMLAPPVLAATGALPQQKHNNAMNRNSLTQKSAGESLHILSLKRTVVFFSKSSVDEQQLQQQQQSSLLHVDNNNHNNIHSNGSSSNNNNGLLLQGQSLAEDVARGIVATSLRGLDVEVAEVGCFKTAGFPRKAVFVFVVGPDSSKGVRRLINYIQSILTTTNADLMKKKKLMEASNSSINNESESKTTSTTTVSHPFRGLSFTIFGIDWLHRSSQEYGGALELELLLQEAGATKIHPTGLTRTGTIDAGISKWRKNLKHNIEVCGPVNGYIESHPQPVFNKNNNNNNGASPAQISPSLLASRTINNHSSNKEFTNFRLDSNNNTNRSFSTNSSSGVSSASSSSTSSSTSRSCSSGSESCSSSCTSSVSSPNTPNSNGATAAVAINKASSATSNGQFPKIANQVQKPRSSSRERNEKKIHHHHHSRQHHVHSNNKTNVKSTTSAAVAELIASSSWEPWISIRPTPASLTAKTSVSIVVALSLTGFAKWIARKCANEARILGYNVAFVGSVTNAEDFLSLPASGFVVILCGSRSPKKLLRGLVRLHATRSDVLSHLSFGCLGVASSGSLFGNGNEGDNSITATGSNNKALVTLTPPIAPSSLSASHSGGISPTRRPQNADSHSKHTNNNNNDARIDVTIPGVEVASHLELCGAQRVFPSAAIDSPSGAETKGLLWLRGVLTAFSRITARRQFFLNQQQQQQLPSLPSATSSTALLLATSGTPEQQQQHAKKKSITFVFTSALTQMMARDMVDEATARNFFPARLLPFTAFREIMDPADGICAAVVVFLCDETTPSGSRTISRFTGALNKSSVLRNATDSCVCVLGIGDRSSPSFTSNLMNMNNNNDDNEQDDGESKNNNNNNNKILHNSSSQPVCPMCPMTSSLAAVVEKYMKPLTSEDHRYASSLKTVDTSDPNVILSIQGFRDDFFFNAVENYQVRTKPFLTSQNLSLLNNNNNNNTNSTTNKTFYFEDHENNNNQDDDNKNQGESIATSATHNNSNSNNNSSSNNNKLLTFNDKKNIIIDEGRHPNDSLHGTSTTDTRNKNEDSMNLLHNNSQNNGKPNIDFSASNNNNNADDNNNIKQDRDSLDTDQDLRKNHIDEDEMEDLANDWFTGQIVDAQTLTSEVTKPPVIFMLFKVSRKNNISVNNSTSNNGSDDNSSASSLCKQQQLQQQLLQQVVWTPGDAIQILPENNLDEVEEILNLLHVKGDEDFYPPNHPATDGKKEEESRFPSAPVYRKMEFPITRREVLKKYLSLKIHNSQVCLMMEKFVTEPKHRAILREVLDFISGSSSTATTSNVAKKSSSIGHDASSSSNNNNNTSSASTSQGNNASTLSSLFSSSSSKNNNTTLTLIEVLRQIKDSVKLIPFRGFVETLPLLQPRCYSITTAHSSDPDHIGIAFKLVKNGVCTQWLQNLAEEHHQLQNLSSSSTSIEIPLRLRLAPEFRMPQDLETPMILIGPGTGVAPFMSFLSHREAELQSLILDEHQYRLEERKNEKAAKKASTKNNNNNDGNGVDDDDDDEVEDPQELLRNVATEVLEAAGAINLYFGCRSKYHDYLFEGDLVEWKQAGVLTSLNVAFSQDSNGGVWFGGLYVQDLLREAGLELCRMILEQHAHVYVCGDAAGMAKDVHQVLLDILMEFRGMSQVQAQKQLKQMEENGAYQRDIWG